MFVVSFPSLGSSSTAGANTLGQMAPRSRHASIRRNHPTGASHITPISACLQAHLPLNLPFILPGAMCSSKKLESHAPPCPAPTPNHSLSTTNSTLWSLSCPFSPHSPLSIPIALSLSTWVISYLNDCRVPSWCPSPLTFYLTVWPSMDTGGCTTPSLVIFFRNVISNPTTLLLKILEGMLYFSEDSKFLCVG